MALTYNYQPPTVTVEMADAPERVAGPPPNTVAGRLRDMLTRYDEIGRDYKARKLGHAAYEEAVAALIRETERGMVGLPISHTWTEVVS